jgi:vacuolar-type H+-ATPase subunit F/Vma7
MLCGRICRSKRKRKPTWNRREKVSDLYNALNARRNQNIVFVGQQAAKEMRQRRLRTSSQCDALREVPLAETKPKKKKWRTLFNRKSDHSHEVIERFNMV